MNQVLYSAIISLLGIGMKIASLFHPKAKLWVNGRKNLFLTLKNSIKKTDRIIWLHASSLGEYEQGLPVLNALKKEYPTYKFVISFYSPSGYEVIKHKNKEDLLFYLPLDTKQNARKLINILNPALAIFVKYDFWYNILQELKNQHCPTIFISAIFRENQVYFKPKGKWFVSVLQNVNHFFVQNENSKKLLNTVGINQVTIAGDTRFDRVKEFLHSENHLPWLEKFKAEKKLLVAGSTWEDDDDLLISFINNMLGENMKVIIVPHNMNHQYFEKVKKQIKYPAILYSELDNHTAEEDVLVIILDTVGMLTKIYSYADIAYVGGAFGKEGVHNVLEPAVFGIPVLYGPNFSKFIEAQELLDCGGSKVIPDKHNIEILVTLSNSPQEIKAMGNNAQKYVLDKPNSTKTILNYIESRQILN